MNKLAYPAITDGPINCGFSELGEAHDRGAKQGEVEPTLEPTDCLTV